MILEVKNIEKFFHDPVEFKVLNDISFGVEKGVGKSGCGKSTLLYILSTMDTEYKGQLIIDGENVTSYGQDQLAAIRNEKIGFIFSVKLEFS